MEPLALTITQAAKLSGICRSVLYDEIGLGRLRAVKRGRSTRILIDDLKSYLAALPAVEPSSETHSEVGSAAPTASVAAMSQEVSVAPSKRRWPKPQSGLRRF
jgi:excisionase family DNA binding protein